MQGMSQVQRESWTLSHVLQPIFQTFFMIELALCFVIGATYALLIHQAGASQVP